MTMQRVGEHEGMDIRRWFGWALLLDDHAPGEHSMLCWLRLPFYGMAYDVVRDTDSYSQLILFLHSRKGFKLRWSPIRNDETTSA